MIHDYGKGIVDMGLLHSKMIFRFHCETFGVTYISANILAPTQEIRDIFHTEFVEPTIAALRDDNAWTTYLESYEVLLQQT